MRRATLNTIGTSSTKPTSKKIGRPMPNATSIIAQCTFLGPNQAISVRAMRSAPPDSAIILPSIVPRATINAMWPSVRPTPCS